MSDRNPPTTPAPDNTRYDTAVYNRRYRRWVREGKHLTLQQAQARIKGRKMVSFPEARFKIVKVPGRKPTS